MGVLRRLRRALLLLFLVVCALLSLALVASQVEQRVFRRRAERLLAEVQSLELRKTPWPEAMAQLQHWAANRQFNDQCDWHWCAMQVTLNESVLGYLMERNLFVRLDDYFRWRFKLSYGEGQGPFCSFEILMMRLYMRVGGRPARVIATVGMRDGIVWSKGFDVEIVTYAHLPESPYWQAWQGQYSLFASAHSRARLGDQGSTILNRPDYAIGRPGGCEICVAVWTEFTPYADPSDIHRLMQFDLSCLTRWRPCLTQRDIMPVAWAEYVAELPSQYGQRPEAPCTPTIIELLGRDSADILMGEVLAIREQVYSSGYRDGVARIRVLKKLKGAAKWNVGETVDVSVLFTTREELARVRPGLSLLLFSGRNYSHELTIDLDDACSPVPASETDLNLVRQGIEQDYSAADTPN